MTEQEKFFFDHGYAQAKRELSKVIEDIKQEIGRYELNCRFADNNKECAICNDNVFGTIYGIIDKHIRKEQE